MYCPPEPQLRGSRCCNGTILQNRGWAAFRSAAFASCFLVLFLFGVAAAGQFEEIAALQRSDFAVAMRLLRPLAAAGNANAQFNLGWMYANGKAFRRITKILRAWHRRQERLPSNSFILHSPQIYEWCCSRRHGSS